MRLALVSGLWLGAGLTLVSGLWSGWAGGGDELEEAASSRCFLPPRTDSDDIFEGSQK